MTSKYRGGLMAIAVAMGAAGCSDGGGGSGRQPLTVDTTTPPESRPLRRLGFAGSLLRAEPRLAAVAGQARRASLVDPVAGREVWGRELASAEEVGQSLPLPDFSGLALISSDGSVSLVGPGLDRATSAPPFTPGSLGAAAESLTYVQVAAKGDRFRYLGVGAGGALLERTVTLPWGEAGSAVAAVSPDGSRILLLLTADGRHVWYRVGADGPVLMSAAVCAGAELAGEAEKVKTLTVDSASDQVLVGYHSGNLRAMPAPAETCVSPDAWPEVTVAEGRPLTDVRITGAGEALVTYAGGVAKVTVAAGELGLRAAATVCPLPVGALPVTAAGLTAVVCLDAVGYDPETSPGETPVVISFQSAFIRLVDPDLAVVRGGAEIPVTGVAGLTLAGTGLVTLLDNALGVLETVDLLSGAVSRRRGLFLRGILD